MASARRADIQGLRAIAVMLVLGYHYFPSRVPGGFVGVDVFFVISGFLISSLLYREIDTTGRLDVLNFYARRVRRLMPAATLTLVVTVVASWFLFGTLRRISVLQDASWTSVYLANYHLAQGHEGYFGNGEPSPLMHYWSLAVEEQFYFVWPLLLLGTVVAWRSRHAVLLLLGVILFGSLAYSMRLTLDGSLDAYYSLATRAWELAVGAVTAWVARGTRRPPSSRIATGAGLVGLIMIGWSALALNESSLFPGWIAAIPTVGTAVAIWSGSFHRGLPIERALAVPPVRFLGDISYSLYLWHWPVVVLLATRYAEGLVPWPVRVVAVFVAVALGALSYALVELPAGRWRVRARGRSVVAIGAAAGVVVAVGTAVAAASIPTASNIVVTAATPTETTVRLADGIVTVTPRGPGMAPSAVPANVRPTVAGLTDDLADIFVKGCLDGRTLVCEGGDPNGSTNILLIGDSQVGHWWPAFDAAGRTRHWRIRVVGYNGCPLAAIDVGRPACIAWRTRALAAARAMGPDLVVFANHAQGYRELLSAGPGSLSSVWPSAAAETLLSLHAPRLLYLGQFPKQHTPPGPCLADHPLDALVCATRSTDTVLPDVERVQKAAAEKSDAWYLDPRDLLCTTVCPVVIQDMIAYRDWAHLSRTYAGALAPRIGDIAAAVLAQPATGR